jgi:hypothetical protein
VVIFFLVVQQSCSGLGSLIVEVSKAHKMTQSHSVGFPSLSGQSMAEASTTNNTKHSEETNIHAPGAIQTHNPSK